MYLTSRCSERVGLDSSPSPHDRCVAGKKRVGKDDDNDDDDRDKRHRYLHLVWG